MVTFAEQLEFVGSSFFRQRVALAAIFGVPIKIRDIRLGDTTAPGLKPYEGDILKLLDELSDGLDLSVDSKTLTKVSLEPGYLIGCEEGELTYKCSLERGLSYYLEFLLMIGPLCKKGIELTLRGVTDHPSDASIDAFRKGAVTMFEKCGIDANVGINVVRRGMLPEGGGVVKFRCSPIKTVSPFRLTYPGRVKAIKGTVWTCHLSPIFARRTLESARRILTEILGHVELYADIVNGDKAGRSRGFGLSLYGETMKGFCYTADSICENLAKKEGKEESQKREEKIAEEAVCRLLAEIAEHGVCDSSFQWIPILFMALSEEHAASRVVLGRLSPNSIGLLRNIARFTSLQFHIDTLLKYNPDVEGSIEGSDDKTDEDEAEIAIIKECKNIQSSQLHVVLSCVGLGLPNMSRKTF